MINIEKIQTQINSLQRCLDNFESAKDICEVYMFSPTSTQKQIEDSKQLVLNTENTLKTQLRIMADDNREELK